MLINRYRYAIEFYDTEGRPVGQAPLSVDWGPAVEGAWLHGLRQARLNGSDGTDGAVIEPIWHDQEGPPYLQGIRVSVPSKTAAGASAEFATDYFGDGARAATMRLVKEGKAKLSDSLSYRILAFADAGGERVAPKRRFKAETVVPALPLLTSRFSNFTGMSRDIEPLIPDDMSVWIRAAVVDETVALSRRAGAVEYGGMLIGHLHRDPDVQDVCVEITAQVPARHTVADSHKLTFTHDTWTAAQAAIDLRGRNEMLLGWWHCHPLHEWCKACPPEKREACPAARGFLSSQDCQLHRAVFPRAYTLALLISHIAEDHLPYALFGWRGGRLSHRGLYLLDDVRVPAEASPQPSPQPVTREAVHKPTATTPRAHRRKSHAAKRRSDARSHTLVQDVPECE